MKRRAAKAKRASPSVDDRLMRIEAEIVCFGEIIRRLERTIDMAVTPTPVEAGEPGDLIGVNEAVLAAGRSAQTLRRWADAGLPVGEYNARLGRYVYSRKALGAYLVAKKKAG